MDELRFRQIHLDFHTSEKIVGIGEHFDADEFADTLRRAHVDSVTCFARCHHGWIYYDSQAHPERKHPHLRRNLLAEQIEACHRRDIRVPIYVTIQWDQFTAERHPEWLEVNEDGRINGTPPYEPGFYRKLLVHSAYYAFLKQHVTEILETFDVDGFFFDIVQPYNDSSPLSKQMMLEQGLDPADPVQRRDFGLKVLNDFKVEFTKFIRGTNKDCTIFYNSGHVGPRHRPVAEAYSHWELESLPSGGWGYLHFPTTIRYARNLGLHCLGMTGKFHTSWGDFHSFKNRPALEFECFQMLAQNAKCSIGDQLHPSGRICPTTYDLIGAVYEQVEEKEPWCRGAKAITEIGVLTPEEGSVGGHASLSEAVFGVTRMLQELGRQFDIIDSAAKLNDYRLILLPDERHVDATLARKLTKFIDRGGAVIASYKSALADSGAEFTLPALGVRPVGDAPYQPDFLKPRKAFATGLADTEHVMYLRGMQVKPIQGAKVLADVIAPYFNRTWEHFCSHKHTPSAGKKAYPGVVEHAQAVYFAHPIFTQYHQRAPRWCKQLLANAIDALMPDPLVQLDAPTTTLVALNEQPAEKRQVLHLLHYVPERRGTAFDVIEDVIPLYDVGVSVKTSRKVKAVTCVPQGEALDFDEVDGRVKFTLPRLDGHQMIELK